MRKADVTVAFKSASLNFPFGPPGRGKKFEDQRRISTLTMFSFVIGRYLYDSNCSMPQGLDASHKDL